MSQNAKKNRKRKLRNRRKLAREAAKVKAYRATLYPLYWGGRVDKIPEGHSQNP